MSQPLNLSLFNNLRARFQTVRVSNEGQQFYSRYIHPAAGGKPLEEVIDPGEHYRVCCPYCNDTRFRLYISYRWNTLDGTGNKVGKYLAYCFNEKCDVSRLESELKLYMFTKPTIVRVDSPRLRNEDMFKDVMLPGTCVPLHTLPMHHPANAYIIGRNFDPMELSTLWGVHYCVEANENSDGLIPEWLEMFKIKVYARLVRNRLIIPIYWQNRLVGWQARSIDGSDPKYYTMPDLKKNRMLYNGDRAQTYKFGVIVEGVFKAWKVGPRAVALLGKDMSSFQRERATAYWGSGALCLLLDPDAADDAERIGQLLNPSSFRWGAFVVVPPVPPDDMDRDELWSLIVAYARNRGITLSPN